MRAVLIHLSCHRAKELTPGEPGRGMTIERAGWLATGVQDAVSAKLARRTRPLVQHTARPEQCGHSTLRDQPALAD